MHEEKKQAIEQERLRTRFNHLQVTAAQK